MRGLSVKQLVRAYNSLPEDFEAHVISAVERLRDAQVELMRLALQAAECGQTDYFASLVGVSRSTAINWAVVYKTFGDEISPDIPVYAYVNAALASGGDREKAENLLQQIAEQGVTAWLESRGVPPSFRGSGVLIVGESFFGVKATPQPWMTDGLPVSFSVRKVDTNEENTGG